MGWLWGTDSASEKRNDAYSKLDPTLRDFLDKESPLKHEDTHAPRPPPPPSQQPSPDAAPNTYRSQIGWIPTSSPSQDAPSTTHPPVPPESLYPDGRYASLWTTYRPQSEIEAAGKNEQDRMRDVIDAYNSRRAAIGRAAVENCVEEQMNERDCWENGSYWEKMNMCRGRNRQFMRCYTMQSRFLKALGYLSLEFEEEGRGVVGGREERVQMHADRLWHEMLEREERAEEARKMGVEVVETKESLSKPEGPVEALGAGSTWSRARGEGKVAGDGLKLSDYTPERQEMIKKQLQGLKGEDRELEWQLIAAERRAQIEVAERISEQYAEERKGRLDRRERGRETVGDTIKRLWGWDDKK